MPQFDLWDKFIKQHKALDRDLQQFQNAVQELGSSLVLVVSIQRMRDQASMIFWILEDNAARLFSQSPSQFQPFSEKLQGNLGTGPTQAPGLYTFHGSLKPTVETLHTELKAMADEIDNLKMAMFEFPEFNMDNDNWPLGQITEDFLYWSDCLLPHLEGHHLKPVQLYIQDLSKEMGDHFQEISRRLVSFTSRVPAVLMLQRRAISNLQNLSTMATFFSAVTATMLQFSIPSGRSGGLGEAVNAFWFGSLVLSVASALNAFLAYTWRSAMYSRLNPNLWRWIRLSPAVFLILSVISFLAGLSCFAVASQGRGTQIVVFACELLSISTLAALLLLTIGDKWKYSQLQHPRKSRADKSRGSGTINNESRRGPSYGISTAHSSSSSIGEDSFAHRLSSVSMTPRRNILISPETSPDHLVVPGLLEEPGRERYSGSLSSLDRRTRQRPLRRLVGKMLGINRVLQASNDAQMAARLTSQLKLVAFTGVQIRLEGEPLVGYPAFSPDGNTLAVSGPIHTLRCDVTSSECKQIVSRENYMGSGQRQVAWSCSGNHLLTWTNQSRFIDVWTENDASPLRITRPRGIGLLIGIQHPKDPTNETETDHTTSEFVIVEGTGMNKLTLVDVQGNVYASGSHSFADIRIDHVDVSCWRPDIRGWFVALAVTVTRSPNGLKPVYATPMRKLKVFNLNKPDFQCDIPIWHEVEDVKFSPNGQTVAVNYRANPPQIWSIKRGRNEMISLTLLRKLLAQSPLTRFRGRLSWLGSGHFLLAVTIAGELYFWRRDRDVAVHVVRAADNDEDKTVEVGCKMVGNDFTFAVRSQDGVVRIWKAYETQQTSTDAS
ncbi:hypothetical protein BU17DRAFT_84727 [Hysterangium stoloniferum]|nr:hypothetical protein BU17DRAFT_84727 [Hysterangium stoloniferum]